MIRQKTLNNSYINNEKVIVNNVIKTPGFPTDNYRFLILTAKGIYLHDSEHSYVMNKDPKRFYSFAHFEFKQSNHKIKVYFLNRHVVEISKANNEKKIDEFVMKSKPVKKFIFSSVELAKVWIEKLKDAQNGFNNNVSLEELSRNVNSVQDYTAILTNQGCISIQAVGKKPQFEINHISIELLSTKISNEMIVTISPGDGLENLTINLNHDGEFLSGSSETYKNIEDIVVSNKDKEEITSQYQFSYFSVPRDNSLNMILPAKLSDEEFEYNPTINPKYESLVCLEQSKLKVVIQKVNSYNDMIDSDENGETENVPEAEIGARTKERNKCLKNKCLANKGGLHTYTETENPEVSINKNKAISQFLVFQDKKEDKIDFVSIRGSSNIIKIPTNSSATQSNQSKDSRINANLNDKLKYKPKIVKSAYSSYLLGTIESNCRADSKIQPQSKQAELCFSLLDDLKLIADPYESLIQISNLCKKGYEAIEGIENTNSIVNLIKYIESINLKLDAKCKQDADYLIDQSAFIISASKYFIPFGDYKEFMKLEMNCKSEVKRIIRNDLLLYNKFIYAWFKEIEKISKTWKHLQSKFELVDNAYTKANSLLKEEIAGIINSNKIK